MPSTKTFGPLTFRIDRPKGTVKTWPRPDGGVKRFVYPVDYGFLPRHGGEDGEALDFFVGDAPDGHLESFQKLTRGADGRYRFDETKFLVGVTDQEREVIYRLYGPEIWHRRTYEDMDALLRELPKFRGRRKTAAEEAPYAVLAKEAGAMDALRRVGAGGRNLFGGHTPTAMPLSNVRPHESIVHRPVPAERPAIPPPYPTNHPTNHPTIPLTAAPQNPHVPRTEPMGAVGSIPPTQAAPPGNFPPTRAAMPTAPMAAHQAPTQQTPAHAPSAQAHVPTVPAAGMSAARGPSTVSTGVSDSGWKPYQAQMPAGAPSPARRTPVERASMSDMLLQAPGARAAMGDLRVRAALGARVTSGGQMSTAKPGTTNALVEHLMRQHPGAEVTPDVILQALKSPEYAATRAQYKGAALRRIAKEAALARYGLKQADLKRADIDKRISGEIMVAGGPRAGDAVARMTGPTLVPGGEGVGPKVAGVLREALPSLGAAFDAFEAERNRQEIIESQKDAIRYPATHFTQPMMMQFASGGGDLASAPTPAPSHHRHRHHHG